MTNARVPRVPLVVLLAVKLRALATWSCAKMKSYIGSEMAVYWWGQGQGETGESLTRHDPQNPLEVPENWSLSDGPGCF